MQGLRCLHQKFGLDSVHVALSYVSTDLKFLFLKYKMNIKVSNF